MFALIRPIARKPSVMISVGKEKHMWKTRLLPVSIFAMLGLALFSNAQTIEYQNPILAQDFPALITEIARAVVTIGVPIAVLALIFAGFKFVQGALGDVKAIEEAKKVLLWTIAGVAVIVGAWAITYAVYNFARTL